MEQQHATVLYEDNQGAILMANAQQPTKRTRHMSVKNFALQEWCERDLIVLHKIHTKRNWSDAFTKAQPRLLFHRHMAHIMGKLIPKYCIEMLGNINHLHKQGTITRLTHVIAGGCCNNDNIPNITGTSIA